MEGFPSDPEPLRAALLRVFELKGLIDEHKIVRASEFDISYEGPDDWGAGTDYYKLNLRIPLELFMAHEAEIEKIEETILDTTRPFWRGNRSEEIRAVVIAPASIVSGADYPVAATGLALPTFWEPGKFRLFLTHCASQKSAVSDLQVALQDLGVSAFVAHMDIEPTKEWEVEIARALMTMEALAAILTADFNQSKWCDQEVGIALGQGKLVIPVRFGADPYGFMGKHQGLAPPSGILVSTATSLVAILLKNDLTTLSMSNAVVTAFEGAWSFANAKMLMGLLETLRRMTRQQTQSVANGLKTNMQIYKSFGIPERVRRLLVKHGHGNLNT